MSLKEVTLTKENANLKFDLSIEKIDDIVQGVREKLLMDGLLVNKKSFSPSRSLSKTSTNSNRATKSASKGNAK